MLNTLYKGNKKNALKLHLEKKHCKLLKYRECLHIHLITVNYYILDK